MDENNHNGPVQYEPSVQVNKDKDGYATAILVLGILSIVCCAPCGIVALALRAGSKDEISDDKQGMVTAGFITSIIGICLWGIALCGRLLVVSLRIL